MPIKKLHKKEREALRQQIAIFDGVAIDFIGAWNAMDYRRSLEILNTIEIMCKRARQIIKEETKN